MCENFTHFWKLLISRNIRKTQHQKRHGNPSVNTQAKKSYENI